MAIDLENEIKKALSEYVDTSTEDMKKAFKDVAKSAVKTLKATSPKDKGKYAKGWKVTDESQGHHISLVVNNSRYQLSHLLENGHKVIAYGKSYGYISGMQHIAPVEGQAIRDIEKAIEEVWSK